MIIYDGLATSLAQRVGIFSIGSSLAGLYLFQSTVVDPTLETYNVDWWKHWGGLTWFTYITGIQLVSTARSLYKVSRIHLLDGGEIAILQFNSGEIIYTAIKSIV